jgi:uncharacterized protein
LSCSYSVVIFDLMRFEWDSKKAAINVQKHCVSFEIAQQVFSDPLHLSIPDPGHSHFEDRWITMGMVKGQLILTVSHTYRDDRDGELVRIISARKATPKERKFYFK